MLPNNCEFCYRVRLVLAILLVSVLLTTPLWLILLTTTLNLTWLQLFGVTAVLQFNLHAALYLQNQLTIHRDIKNPSTAKNKP